MTGLFDKNPSLAPAHMPIAWKIYFCDLCAWLDESADVFHNIETDVGNFSLPPRTIQEQNRNGTGSALEAR